MGSLSDMIINAFSQLWHLIPIILVVVLFKKFIDKKDKDNRRNKNEENEKNGLTLELRTIKKYESLAYKIEHGKEDQEIDLICFKDGKTLLLLCDNTTKSKSITDEHIKKFHANAIKYVETNHLEKSDVKFRYVISNKEALNKSASKILMNDSYNCKYVVL
jgi:hypothetical protein